MSRPRPPLFLERESYRRRRLMDGARILPVIGLVLFLLPALWRAETGPETASEALYLFAVWALLILTAALLARPLRRTGVPQPDSAAEPDSPAYPVAPAGDDPPPADPGRAP